MKIKIYQKKSRFDLIFFMIIFIVGAWMSIINLKNIGGLFMGIGLFLVSGLFLYKWFKGSLNETLLNVERYEVIE